MADTEQTITAKFVADTKGFTAGAEEVVASSKAVEESTANMGKGAEEASQNIGMVGTSAEKAGQEAGQAAGGLSVLGEESTKAGKSAKEAGSSAKEGGGGFNILGGGAMGAISAIMQVGQVVGQVVGTLSQMSEATEKTAIAFTYLTGSADKAQQEIKTLNESTAAATFGKQNIDNAAQHFLALGYSAETTQKEINRVSDAVAAAGGSAKNIEPVIQKLHDIQGEAIVTTKDIDTLTNDGIDGWQALAEGMSASRGKLISVQEAQKEVNSGAESGKKAYQDLMLGMQQYGGEAVNQSQTLDAEWTRLGENAAKAFGPIADLLAKDLEAINELLEGTHQLSEALKDLGQGMTAVGINPLGPLGAFIGHADGITDSPTSHMAMVGENGPELMMVPQGASIFPNGTNFSNLAGANPASLTTLVGGSSSGPQTVLLQVMLDSRVMAQQMIPLIAPQIRVLTGGRK